MRILTRLGRLLTEIRDGWVHSEIIQGNYNSAGKLIQLCSPKVGRLRFKVCDSLKQQATSKSEGSELTSK